MNKNSIINFKNNISYKYSSDILEINYNNHRYMFKGDKTSKYLAPIIDDLIFPQTIIKLWEKLIIVSDINECNFDEFHRIFDILYKKGILNIQDLETDICEINNKLEYSLKTIKNLQGYIKIAIVDRTYNLKILDLIDKINVNDCIRTDLFMLANDILVSKMKKINSDINIYNYHPIDYNSLIEKIDNYDLVILIQNQYYNSLTESISNSCFGKEISFLNCAITNQFCILGPFVIDEKVANIEDVRKNNVYEIIKSEYASPLFEVLYRSSGLQISYSLIEEEIYKFILNRFNWDVPNTVESIFIFNMDNYIMEKYRLNSFHNIKYI